VRDADGPITREAAADAVGISRKLAAFHLDKLVAAGLLVLPHLSGFWVPTLLLVVTVPMIATAFIAIGIVFVQMATADSRGTAMGVYSTVLFLGLGAGPAMFAPLMDRSFVVGFTACALVGGETAILPDFYAAGDYDMAGFCVGVVERDNIINGRGIRPGDLVLGLASTGLHSNGYSLVRKIVFEKAGLKINDFVLELGRTVAEELLEPTRIYVRAIKLLLEHYPVKRRVLRGLAHITGEGLEGNIPRILPPGRRVFLDKSKWPTPPVFSWLQNLGPVDEAEMFKVFNMGIGFVVITSPYYAESIQRQLNEERVKTYIIGEVREGEPGVEFV